MSSFLSDPGTTLIKRNGRLAIRGPIQAGQLLGRTGMTRRSSSAGAVSGLGRGVDIGLVGSPRSSAGLGREMDACAGVERVGADAREDWGGCGSGLAGVVRAAGGRVGLGVTALSGVLPAARAADDAVAG